MVTGTYILIISLNVSELMLQTKDTNWLNKLKDPYSCYIQETHLEQNDTGLKWENWKIYFIQMITQREQRISRILNHTLRIKIVPTNKGHHVKIKGSTPKNM